jgi:DNA polymerase-3 subunit gamma/tau
MGYDLRAVCRELSRVVRDLLVLTVDPSRVNDPEIAGEGERDRLKALAARFSREDLLRAFDLLTKAETDIRGAAQPRYHLEMALLRWIHLRKLVPIEDLIAGVSGGPERPALRTQAPPAAAKPEPQKTLEPQKEREPFRRAEPVAARQAPATDSTPSGTAKASGLKDALLAEIRKSKMVFYQTVCAQAQKIEAAGDRVTFMFSSNQKTLLNMFEQNRAWLESIAQQVAGRRIAVAGVQADAAAPPAEGAASADAKSAEKKSALRDQALADAGVQTMLEVFPAEIRDVEEM